MQTLPRPSFTVSDVFKASISKVRQKDLKDRLINCLPEIIDDAQKYEEKVTSAELYLFPKKTVIAGNVTAKELEKVYTYRMVPKNSPGRIYYNKLRYPQGSDKCPLCGQRPLSTLDHYLSKTDYPTLSVLPINLVPACKDCNYIKSNSFPTKSEEETLHPYFDNIEGDKWLYATVNKTSPPSLTYYIDAPSNAPLKMAERVKYHFDLYDLGTLYTSEAAAELADISYLMKILRNDIGPEAVQEHLSATAQSCEINRMNSWKSAMYQALASDPWYCDKGAKL